MTMRSIKPFQGNYSQLLILLPVAVLILTALPNLLSPTFCCDPSRRLFYADRLIAVNGSRQWLPFLQAHLYALYQFYAPITAFQLIPILYSIAGMVMISILGRKILGSGFKTDLFLAFTLTSFVLTSTVNYHSYRFYQETVLYPLLLGILYIYSYQTKYWPLTVLLWILSFLTREYAWIYLAVALPFRLANPRVSLVEKFILPAVFLIPVGWVWYTHQPVALAGSQQGLPKDMDTFVFRVAELYKLSSDSYLNFTVPSFAILAIICFFSERGLRKTTALFQKYLGFSIVSLVVMYGYIILTYPFSPDNPRAILPIAHHVPLLALGLYSILRNLPNYRIRIICQIGLFLTLALPAVRTDAFQDFSLNRPAYLTALDANLQREWELHNSQHTLRPSVVVVGSDWFTFEKYFIGPLLQWHGRLAQSVFGADLVVSSEALRWPNGEVVGQFDIHDSSNQRFLIWRMRPQISR
jgi:hypothetical protein